MMFSLRTFGGLKLLDNDGHDVAFPEKGLLILGYLLAGSMERELRSTMAHFLWGHDDNGSAQVNLRKLVSRIKSRQAELGVQFVRFTETVVELEPSSLTSDITFLDGADQPFSKLALLVKTLESEFLAGANCQSAIFRRWLEAQKYRHAGLLKETLALAAVRAVAKEEVALVKEAALLIFSADPENADIHRILLKIFDAAGEVEHFRQIFEGRGELLASWSRLRAKSPPILELVREPGSAPTPKVAAEMSPKVKIPRLVLLPPGNYSRNSGAAMIAASLIEDITIGFCALNSLQVIAPYTAVQISRQNEDPLVTFERHDIAYILDTRLSGQDGEISLFSQLIEFASSEIVWAERFSLELSSLVRQRRDISRRIALSVASQIERHEMTRSHFEENPTAYHRYLMGRRYLNRLTLPNLRRARKELKTSLEESENFAPALSSIARTYSKEWLLTARGDVDLLKSAEKFAMQAIAARHNMADGYRELGVAKVLQGAIDESVEALELAETLSPHYADVIADHADTLVHFSRPGLALQKIERAIELNPLSPDSYLWTASGASYCLGHFEGALGYIDRMADPTLVDRLSAASWAMLGNGEKARFFVRRARETNPDFDVDKWLSVVPLKEQWQKDIYREGLKKAGF
jgi:TolB-like protein/DNA-binding SARP family transcriptional activator